MAHIDGLHTYLNEFERVYAKVNPDLLYKFMSELVFKGDHRFCLEWIVSDK